MLIALPSVYQMKPRLQRALRPLAASLGTRGVTPNAVTLAALLGSAVVGGVLPLAAGRPRLLTLLAVWLAVRMALNALDGMIARGRGLATPGGAALNELGDVLSDLLLYLPLAVVHRPAATALVAFALAAVLTEFCGLLARAIGGERRYDGPMGKSDRALLVGLLAAATALRPELVRAWAPAFGLGAALAGITCWTRISAGLRIAAGARC